MIVRAIPLDLSRAAREVAALDMRRTLDPTHDIVFKLLFAAPASRDILASLLTAVLQPSSPVLVVEVRNPEVLREQVTDKAIVLDLHVVLADGRFLDVEMQAQKRPAFRERAMLYWARLYASQLERGDEFTALRPVISILFLSYLEADTQMLHDAFGVTSLRTGHLYTDVLQLHVVSLPFSAHPDEATRQGEPKLLAWSRFLAAETDEELESARMTDPMIAKAQQRLEELSADPKVQELVRLRKLARAVERMEETARREEWEAEARARALEAEARGEARGEAKALRETILALATALGVEVDDARRGELEALTPSELTALRDQLITERRW